jgi:hypothetical protein
MTSIQAEYNALCRERNKSETGSVVVTFPSGAVWQFVTRLDDNGYPVWAWKRAPARCEKGRA